ncbi:hypothetical protein [Corallococcus sp. 4LFB]|uniref:hypothetical protein n=1 Tax=Corallococcus sp. 4LFB TaxID=3383249 RepID=UPI003975B75E
MGDLEITKAREVVILQTGEMSGDMFQVAAALLVEPRMRVHIIGDKSPGPRDKADDLYRFYVGDTGISTTRVTIEKVDSMGKRIKKLKTDRKMGNGTPARTVGLATNILQAAFERQDWVPHVREHWLSDQFYQTEKAGILTNAVSESELAFYVKAKKIPLHQPIVVLWSRHSGKSGGLHPDLDSSYTGLRELVRAFSLRKCTPIVVGDDRKNKFLHDKEFQKYGAIVLPEFWKEQPFAGKLRSAQFRLFDYLNSLCVLSHVGMRSGNLEAYAYLGHHVVFLEDQRTDSGRMDKLVVPRILLNMTTVKLSQLPTATGKLYRDPSQVIVGEKSVRELVNEVKKLNKSKKPSASEQALILKSNEYEQLNSHDLALGQVQNFKNWVTHKDGENAGREDIQGLRGFSWDDIAGILVAVFSYLEVRTKALEIKKQFGQAPEIIRLVFDFVGPLHSSNKKIVIPRN